MLDEESHERDDELDTDELIKKELVEHPEVLEVIEERKKRKFTWSGLAVMVVGAALIVFGLTLHTGVNSLEGLLVAAGGSGGVCWILCFFFRLIEGIVLFPP